MKKSLIAGASVAALGMAALPFAGVFAQSLTFTDVVKVAVQSGCSFEVKDGSDAIIDLTSPRVFYQQAELGQVVTLGGTNNTGEITDGTQGATATSEQNITVTCNTSDAQKSWTVTAVGSQTTGNENKMLGALQGSTAITTNAQHLEDTSGDTSYWSMMIDSTSASNDYDDWNVIPDTATEVATGTASTTAATFAPAYRVYVGTAQEADTYTGKVTYTLSDTF